MVHGVVPAGRQVLVDLSASLGGHSWSEAQQLMLSASSTLCVVFFGHRGHSLHAGEMLACDERWNLLYEVSAKIAWSAPLMVDIVM